ncbi:MAG: Hsp20/alpha crystallin family protein [Thermodesulfobacteriota bacterium]
MTRTLLGWPFWGWKNPFDELDRVKRQLDAISGGRNVEWPWSQNAGVFPLLNVTETAERYKVTAELPGIKAQELSITVTGNTLSLSGNRAIAADPEASYHRRERKAGAFSRVITLPGDVDAERVSAESKNGVLTILLPKAAAARPRQISVKAG